MTAIHDRTFLIVGKEALIAFFCMKPDHRAAQNGTISDHLTVTEGVWAYCAKDARLADHVWEPTGGIAMNEVERFARSRDARDMRDPGDPRQKLDDRKSRDAHR